MLNKLNKIPTKLLLTLVFILLASIIFLLRINKKDVSKVQAWWDETWTYRQAIDIGNSNPATTNQYVKITLDTSTLITANKMQSDCDDIRITNNNGNLLTHYVDGNPDYDCNETDTSIYIIVDTLPDTNTTLYIYYGNSSANNIEPTIGTSTTPALSCRHIKEHGDGDTDGLYYLTLSGNISNNIQSYCNMTTASGGWTLIFQRRGDNTYHNTESCGANLNAFLRDTCGSTNSLAYTDSYSIDLDNIENYGEFLLIQYDSNLSADTDDAFIVQSTDNIFPNSTGSVDNLAVTAICDINNSNCDSTDAYIKYTGDGWWGSTVCSNGYSTGAYLGNYGYCQNGVSTSYVSNGLFGNRSAYDETKLWAHDNNSDLYMERVFVRETSYSFSNFPAGAPQSEEVTPGPIAYWKFDEGVGTTAHDSAGSNHGTITGAIWQTEDKCISDKCLYFDGANDNINFGNATPLNNFGTQDFSISVWVIINSYQDYTGIITNKIVTDNSKGLAIFANSSGTISAKLGNDSTNTTSTITAEKVSTNQWHYITYIRQSNHQYLYLDGKLEDDDSTSTTYDITNTSTTYISSNSYDYNGTIDEVKIYPYARTASQIKADYTSGLAGMGGNSAVNIGGDSTGKSLSDGLVGYWKMDETSTPSIDSSGNGNSGTWNGTADDAAGKFGSAINLDGDSDYVSVPNDDFIFTNSFTLSGWIKRDDDTRSPLITLGDGNDYNNRFRLRLRSAGAATPSFIMGQSGTSNVSATSLNASISGQWYHLAGVYNHDNKKLYLYVNGNLEAESNSEFNEQWYDPGSTPVKIGFDSNYLNGLIDEVRIYNRALSASEVQTLYNWAPGPIAYYNFNEGVGTSAFDTSGNGNNGVWSGTGTHWDTGKFGKAGKFDGDDYVNVTYAPSLETQNVSVGAWIKKDNYTLTESTWPGIAIRTGWEYGIYLINDYYLKMIIQNGTNEGPGYDLRNKGYDGKWIYVYGTVSDDKIKLYVNGQLVNTVDRTLAISTTENPFQIGQVGGLYKFNGLIDEVKVYNYARTPKQILEDMQGRSGASKSTLPIAHWRFDEGYGTIARDSIGTNHGTFGAGSSAPSWTNNGKIGKALSFDGSGDYLSVSNPQSISNTPQISISTWINPAIEGVWRGITGSEGSGAFHFQIRQTNILSFYLYGPNSSAESTTSFSGSNLNRWHHVVGTYNGSSIKLYVNGKLEGETNGLSGNVSSSGDIRIGRAYSGDRSFNGLIDEVKIYNYALSQDEIAQDYNQGKSMVMGQSSSNTGSTASPGSASQEYCIPGSTDPCSPPIAEWNFEENVGTTAYDTSGNGNHAVFGAGSSAPSWSMGHNNTGAGPHFDGANDYITTPINLPSTHTITFWAKQDAFLSNPSGFAKILVGGGNNQCDIYAATDSVNYYDGGSAMYASFDFTKWSNVAVVINGTDGQLFINGILKDTDDAIGSTCTTTYIGGGVASRWFNGSIDQVRIYNYARTPAQIAWDYNRGQPIAHWKFDECQGTTAYDSSGNGNNGTISIGATAPQTSAGTCTDGQSTSAWYNGATGKLNSSLNFDGVDDYVIKSDFTSLTSLNNNIPFSISAWIKPASISGEDYIMSTYYTPGGDEEGFLFYLSSGNPTFEVHDVSTPEASVNVGSAVPTGSWSHLIALYDNSYLRIYVNGILKSSTAYTDGTYFDYTVSPYPRMRIGLRSTGNYFNGLIDDVRIYNYALTGDQVKTLYNNGAVTFR